MAKFCPECGAQAEGMKFCPECGTALNGNAAAASTPAPAPAAAVEEEEERELWKGQPDRVFASIGERSNTYVLTTERLRVDSGMLRKKAESLDLWRVKDVAVKKSMTQRTRKCGDVEITSADASTPKVTLTWIQNPDEVAEQVRQAARDARKRHGVATQERF
jgi:uncharacterized Zn finger protein (UPF0148 family)